MVDSVTILVLDYVAPGGVKQGHFQDAACQSMAGDDGGRVGSGRKELQDIKSVFYQEG